MNTLSAPLPLASAVQALSAGVVKLPLKDREFAQSLISQFHKKKTLSPKQIPYVYTLLGRLEPAQQPTISITIEGLSNIAKLFDRAKAKLKYPSIQFTYAPGQVLKIWVQGETAKIPGAIGLTVNKVWIGRIHPNGRFETANAFMQLADPDAVLEILRDFSDDPAGTAAKLGKLASRCVFCQTPLTDGKSLAVGYGSTCAKNYGLEWGGKILDFTTLNATVAA